jgi:CcmD family protein
MSSVGFMHAAYAAVWIVLGGYIAKLFVTYLRLKEELNEVSNTPLSGRPVT